MERFYGLDIIKATVYVESDERFFIGLEKPKTIKFIRIRSILELLLPKLILKFEKDDFSSYKIRYALLPFILLLFILIGLIHGFFAILKNINDFDIIIFPVIISICFFLFTKIELKLIHKKIMKSIENIKNNWQHGL